MSDPDWITPADALALLTPVMLNGHTQEQLMSWLCDGSLRSMFMRGRAVRLKPVEVQTSSQSEEDLCRIIASGPILVADWPKDEEMLDGRELSKDEWVHWCRTADAEAWSSLWALSVLEARDRSTGESRSLRGVRFSQGDIIGEMELAGLSPLLAQCPAHNVLPPSDRQPVPAVREQSLNPPKKRRGRPEGTDTYPEDAAIVRTIIAACEPGVPGAITREAKKHLDAIQPPSLSDADKVRRIRGKVRKVRPDLL